MLINNVRKTETKRGEQKWYLKYEGRNLQKKIKNSAARCKPLMSPLKIQRL